MSLVTLASPGNYIMSNLKEMRARVVGPIRTIAERKQEEMNT